MQKFYKKKYALEILVILVTPMCVIALQWRHVCYGLWNHLTVQVSLIYVKCRFDNGDNSNETNYNDIYWGDEQPYTIAVEWHSI